jgi:hypothetical protein
MRNRRKHWIVGRLALPFAALALAAPALAVPDGYLAQNDRKNAVIGHPDGTDSYQPQLQANESPKLELRRQAPAGSVPKVYVTSSVSTRQSDIPAAPRAHPLAPRGLSPAAAEGGLDGTDTGIGAGVAFGGLLLASGLALAMRRRSRPAVA